MKLLTDFMTLFQMKCLPLQCQFETDSINQLKH